MIPAALVATISFVYFAILFAVAFYADQQREAGRSIVSNAHAYSLSLAVYFTAWSFYGNIGRVATVGLDFLPPDLSPTLMAFAWWFLLRKVVRVSKEEKITTIADFISSRYGKSVALGALVTLFTVVGIMPYIALESVVKLVAIVAVGLFVTYGLFDGVTDIFARFAAEFPDRQHLLRLGTEQIPYSSWFTLNLLSMMAFMLLPRQFHIMVIENSASSSVSISASSASSTRSGGCCGWSAKRG